MDGSGKTSTLVVTRRVLLSPYLRSKMGTALVGSPRLSGNLLTEVSGLLIMIPSYSTYLASDNSLPKEAREEYSPILSLVLILGQVLPLS